jgi:4-amino-4-deoxy-L-arabinose transferase-like glycosyltransferase
MLVFLALSVGLSLARAPWWDEGVFADVALNFRNFGHLGSSVLAPHGYLDWPGVHQYTYWQFPLYLIALGSWFKLVPLTVVWMRLFSVMWGCVFVVSWFVVVRSLSRNEPLALLVASVVALEYDSVVKASTGRMDMMCAALGLAGLASYSRFRDSAWTRGVILAAWLGAASLFCHPMGAVMNASIAAMVLWDWRRIRWRPLAAASLPYLIGIAGCLYYIRQAPDVFLAQSRAASEYRVGGLSAILHNVLNDANKRYILYYSGYTGMLKLRAVTLVFLAGGVVGLLARRNLRSQPVAKRLLLLACIAYVGVAVVDSEKFPHYLVFSVPFFAACGAVWVYGCWREAGLGRLLASGLLGASVLVAICGVGYRIYGNGYRNLYQPAVAAVRSSLPPGGIVMGGSELGFALGFGPPLVDDRYLGFFSGETPDVFVVNGNFYNVPWPSPRLMSGWRSSRIQLGNQYHLTFENSAYSVYVRKGGSPPGDDREGSHTLSDPSDWRFRIKIGFGSVGSPLGLLWRLTTPPGGSQ